MLQTSSKVLDDLFKEKLCFTFNATFFEARVWMISWKVCRLKIGYALISMHKIKLDTSF